MTLEAVGRFTGWRGWDEALQFRGHAGVTVGWVPGNSRSAKHVVPRISTHLTATALRSVALRRSPAMELRCLVPCDSRTPWTQRRGFGRCGAGSATVRRRGGRGWRVDRSIRGARPSRLTRRSTVNIGWVRSSGTTCLAGPNFLGTHPDGHACEPRIATNLPRHLPPMPASLA